MPKQTFDRAASMVRAILDGEWTNEPPSWANASAYMGYLADDGDDNYSRAVQTAEAFILLFKAFNDCFDEQRFLVACGLAEKTTKKGRTS